MLYATSFRTNKVQRKLEKIRRVKKKTNNSNFGASKLLHKVSVTVESTNKSAVYRRRKNLKLVRLQDQGNRSSMWVLNF